MTFRPSGGTTVSNRSDTLNDSRPSATSNHTFTFTPNSPVTASSTLSLTFPSGFSVPSTLNCGDVNAATSSQFNFNYPGCAATATAWGFAANGSVLTLQAPTGPALVQKNGAFTNTQNSLAVAFPSNNTAGDLLVAVAGGTNSNDVFGVSDSLGNTYTTATSITGNLTIWYAANAKGGANTVTFTCSQFFGQFQIYEYSGVSQVNPLDQVGSSKNTFPVLSVTTVGATAQANELVMAFILTGNGVPSPTFTAGSGYTLEENVNDASNFSNTVGEDTVASAAGIQNATFTDSDTPNPRIMAIVTFKAAPVVAAGTPLSIYIGLNATSTRQGVHTITNPSTAGTYTIAVGGTSGNSGNIPVFIQSGVTVSATMAENLAFTIWPAPAITLLQKAVRSGVLPLSITFPQNNTASSLIIVASDKADDGNGFIVSDSQGNTYTSVGSIFGWCSIDDINVSYAKNVKAGPNTVTVTDSPNFGVNANIQIYEYSGADLTSPLDQSGSTQGISSCGTQVVSVTTTGAAARVPELVFAATNDGHYSSNPAFTPGSGYAMELTSTSFPFTAGEDTSIFDGGKQTATWNTNSNGNFDAVIATFKAASGAGYCNADDGATVTQINSTATSIPFGTVSPNTFYQGCQDLSVSTNAGGGYSLAAWESSALLSSGGQTIPDTACDTGCTSASAGKWVTPANNGFGYTCVDQVGHDCMATFKTHGEGSQFTPVANVAANSNGITFIQGAAQFGVMSEAFPSQNFPGNFIVVGMGYGSASTPGLSISDSEGNSYATAVGPIVYGGADYAVIWYAKNIRSGANTVSVSSSNALSGVNLLIQEYSGIAQNSPLDVVASNTGSCSGTCAPISSGSATTNANNELVFGFAVDNQGEIGGNGTGFIKREGNSSAFSEDEIGKQPGAYQATFPMFLDPGSAWAALMTTFRPSTDTREIFMSSSTPAIATGRVKFRLSVGSQQPAGVYSNTIVYTIVPTF